MKPFSIICAAVFFAMLAIPVPVRAHSFPSGEEPRVGSTIQTAPARVSIKFDNPIEALFSRLEVTDDSNHSVTAGDPARSDDHRELSVPVKPLPSGDYHVKWSVVAEDGHRTEGSYIFTVAGKR